MGDTLRNQPSDEDLGSILAIAAHTAFALGVAPHEVDEISQLTAIKLWSKWNTTHVEQARRRSPSRWRGYVIGTAKNVHRDLIRSHKRRVNRQNTAAGGRQGVPTDRPGVVAVAPSRPTGVDSFLARAEIIDAIRQLPPRQQVVAVLIVVDELTMSEAAAELGIQPQSVRKTFRSARAALRDWILAEEEEAGQRQSL